MDEISTGTWEYEDGINATDVPSELILCCEIRDPTEVLQDLAPAVI